MPNQCMLADAVPHRGTAGHDAAVPPLCQGLNYTFKFHMGVFDDYTG
jgi:hypothetical protein